VGVGVGEMGMRMGMGNMVGEMGKGNMRVGVIEMGKGNIGGGVGVGVWGSWERGRVGCQ
jgi:hypothetical protein